eukprot:1506885-Pleurochrysis_carterae.AAC.1
MLPPSSRNWCRVTEFSTLTFFPWRVTSRSTRAPPCDSLPLRTRCAMRTRCPPRLRLRAPPHFP